MKIVAVDFDGTLVEELDKFDPTKAGDLLPDAKDVLQKLKKDGFKIIIFTVRDNLDLVRKTLDDNLVPYDTINENIKGMGSTSPKPFANYYIDNRAVRFVDWKSVASFIEEDMKDSKKNDVVDFVSDWHTIKRTDDGYEYNEGKSGVAILPYRQKKDDKKEFLLRKEDNPVLGDIVTVITGRNDENENSRETASRELKEESGYLASSKDFEYLGELALGKDSYPPDQLFCIDLTGVNQGDVLTDGTEEELKSSNFWVSEDQLIIQSLKSLDSYLSSVVLKFLYRDRVSLPKEASYDRAAVLISDIPNELVSWIINVQKDISGDIISTSKKEDGGSVVEGVETFPHITVLYGVQSKDFEDVKTIFDEFNVIPLETAGIDYFDQEDRTVVVVRINSPELEKLHYKLRESIPNVHSNSYLPHITIAYLKKGERFDITPPDIHWDVNEIQFSDKDESLKKIAFSEEEQFDRMLELEKFLRSDFVLSLLEGIFDPQQGDIFDLIKFGHSDHLAYYDRDEGCIIFDYDGFHKLLKKDIEKLFKVLIHEFTHLVDDLQGELIIPAEDVVTNYFENPSEIKAVKNEIKFFKNLGYSDEDIEAVFSDSFLRFGNTFTDDLKRKLKEYILETN